MRTQLIAALARAGGGFLHTLLRIARQLFHETTGAIFFLFAILGGATAWREWQKRSAQWLVGAAIAFTVMMTVFAVASFRNARRVR
jgi:predicted negative regulator of RcsB-dependent stress response